MPYREMVVAQAVEDSSDAAGKGQREAVVEPHAEAEIAEAENSTVDGQDVATGTVLHVALEPAAAMETAVSAVRVATTVAGAVVVAAEVAPAHTDAVSGFAGYGVAPSTVVAAYLVARTVEPDPDDPPGLAVALFPGVGVLSSSPGAASIRLFVHSLPDSAQSALMQ